MSDSTQAIRTLIVDDERPARLWLRTLCSRASGLQIVGECTTAEEASQRLREGEIDLLLLDIQLGPRNGFQVLDGLPVSSIPTLVFVTAHDQYAIQAFERRAIDYLLKPVREDRFHETLARVRERLHGEPGPEGQGAVRDTIGLLERSLIQARGRGHAERLIAERKDAYHVIKCADIILIESEGNYIRVTEVNESTPAFLRGTLQSVAAVLDSNTFVRINRSVIANIAYVSRIERDQDARYVFRMSEIGRTFRVGRSFHARVVQRMRLGHSKS
jgi:two-component system LytT family response regulator